MEKKGNTLKDEAKKINAQQTLKNIYDRFKDLQSEENPKASLRVKLLIKNMFENKASGWVKSREEDKEIKKKSEIEASVTKQAEDKQKESDSNDRGNYRDDNYNDRGNKGSNYNNDQRGGGKGRD
jgi:hypothetical protein